MTSVAHVAVATLVVACGGDSSTSPAPSNGIDSGSYEALGPGDPTLAVAFAGAPTLVQ